MTLLYSFCKALARFQEVTNRYTQEKQTVRWLISFLYFYSLLQVLWTLSSEGTLALIDMCLLWIMVKVDELLKQRDSIHSSFSVVKTPSGSNLSNGSSSKAQGDESKGDGASVGEEGGSESRDKSKRKWFNLNLKGSDKKVGWPHFKRRFVVSLFYSLKQMCPWGVALCVGIYIYMFIRMVCW